MIFITSDHGGFNLKTTVCQWLNSKGYLYKDLGPSERIAEDDYPEYAENLIRKMKEEPNSIGIITCRNGVGMSMYANKYEGIRAALSWDPRHAKSSRNDDNANVLVLPADYINEDKALEVIEAWLDTPFSNFERHIRRLSKFPKGVVL